MNPNNSRKLIDAFLFFNEIEMLKARLEYLGPVVDYFVISEANIDFSGKKKSLVLNKELISSLPFSKKIIYHSKEIDFNNLYWIFKKIRYRNNQPRLLWKLQDAQRNALLEPLKNFDNHDLIIFSDIDEFPSIDALNFFQTSKCSFDSDLISEIYSCKQIFYYYDLNHAAINDEFYGSILSNLKIFRKHLPHKIKSSKNDYKHIENGGWHFSYFMSEEKIRKKILAISDVENLSNYKNLNVQQIKQKIISNADLYDRNIILSNDLATAVPNNLRNILKKYLPECV